VLNSMSYEALFLRPFQFLPMNEVNSLSKPQFAESKRLYIDCLTLLNDILTEYTSYRVSPRMSFKQNKKLLNEYMNLLNKLKPEVYNTLIIDRDIAFDFCEEFSRETRTVTSHKAHLLAERYVDDLLKQYEILRHAS
jgi:hypothetical protein